MCHYLGGGLHGRQKRVKAQSESSKSVVNSVLISREMPVFPGFLEIIRVVVSILKITGIIGGSFGISSPLDSYISFKLFEDGFNAATILNICLFIPYGFLPVFIFKNIHKHWWNGVILGAVFSIGIEFLQTFIGRFAQLDDVIMNTCGTLVGFLIGCLLLRITTRKK